MISARVSQDLQDKTSGQQNTMTQSFNFTNHDLTGMECNEYALLQDASIDLKNSLEPLNPANPQIETVMREREHPRQLTP